MRVYERLVWPLLSGLDPERAHEVVLSGASAVQSLPSLLSLVRTLNRVADPRLAVSWKGLTFPNPIGLAAGLDKDGRAPRFFEALGFGFVEVGTVTPLPQKGNRRPRVHRLPDRLAMVNSMGFPGNGMDAMAERLSRTGRMAVPLGINVGKNAVTPLARAAEDYATCLRRLYPYGDYFVVNVSSPNTMGLTSLQAKPALRAILAAVLLERKARADHERPKPVLVKVSPDLTDMEMGDVLDLCGELGMEGLIATNTSADPARKAGAAMAGGISGPPLAARAVDAVRFARRNGPPGLFIIGVGGVSGAEQAWALLEAGADVVQLYTALIYQGPRVVDIIKKGLSARLQAKGLATIQGVLRGAPRTG